MHSDRGNKDYTSIKYKIENVNKMLKIFEQKKKTLINKRNKFVECEECKKHFRKDILYLSAKAEPLDACDDLNSILVYFWICPYCGKKQTDHYEESRCKKYWGTNDW